MTGQITRNDGRGSLKLRLFSCLIALLISFIFTMDRLNNYFKCNFVCPTSYYFSVQFCL